MLFKLLFSAAFLNALVWTILIPVFQYPDEQAHFAQVQDFAEIGSLPQRSFDTSNEIQLVEQLLKTERDSSGNNSYTYHPKFKLNQAKSLNGAGELKIKKTPLASRTNFVKNESTQNPPAYYFLASLFYKISYFTDIFSRIYFIRLLSISLIMITIFFVFKTAKQTFENQNQAILLTTLVSFMPMFVFSSTGILPDPLTTLLFTIIIYLSTRMILYRINIKIVLLLSSTTILGLLTRQHFIIAIPIILLAVALKVTWNYKKLIIFLLVCFTSISSIALSSIYAGLFPFIEYLRIPDIDIFNADNLKLNPLVIQMKWFIENTLSQTLPWYWGVYKWLSLTLPLVYYQIINRILALAALGVIIRLIKFKKQKYRSNENKTLIFAILANVLYYLLFLIWNSFFAIKNNFSFGIQGRYFFPLIFTQIYILYLGIMTISEIILKDKSRYASYLLILIMITFNDLSLIIVSSSYYDTTNLSIFIKHASQYKPDILKGNIIIVFITMALISQLYYLIKLQREVIGKKYEGP